MRKKINNIETLKEISKDGVDCFILLNAGIRSSKHILYDDDDKIFYILNEIDDSEQELTEQQLMDLEYTNIGVAILKGALFEY